MIRQFIKSIRSLQAIYDARNNSWLKTLVYYLLLTLIISFPINLQVVRNKGLQVDVASEQIKEMVTEDFRDELPTDCQITSYGGLSCTESANVEVDAGDLLIVFNAEATYEAPDNSLVFYEERIVFTKDSIIRESDYTNYEEPIVFSDLQRLPFEDARVRLIAGFKEPFEAIDILSGTIFVTSTYLFMNAIYIIIASMIAMLMKFGHPNFIKYREVVKILIYSSTIPTVIGFVLGIFKLQPFIPVIYQFGTPLVFLIVYYKRIVPDLSDQLKKSYENKDDEVIEAS